MTVSIKPGIVIFRCKPLRALYKRYINANIISIIIINMLVNSTTELHVMLDFSIQNGRLSAY